MSGISIDKNLDAGKKISFRIEMEFFGYSQIKEFELTVPKAAPLLNKIDTITVTKKPGRPNQKTKGNYSFSKYAKGINDGSFYRLKLLLDSAKQANQLKPGEEVNLSSSDAKLNALNNKNFKVIPDTNSDPRYVYLRVHENFQPTVVPASSAIGSLQEITGIIPTTNFTVTLPNNVFNNLITELTSTTAPQNGAVEDIPIFAYKRFTGNNSSAVKRKLMINGDNISDKEPPDRDAVLEYRRKKSYSRTFENDQEEKFLFYVAIARYSYKGDVWKKEWLQENKSGEALWGKAVDKTK